MQMIVTGAVGLVLTALLLILPSLHAQTWFALELSPISIGLLGLPLLVLCLAVVGGRRWVALWAFPVSHLPALIAIGPLADPVIYGEVGAPLAGVAIAITAVAWFALHLWRPQRARGPRRRLGPNINHRHPGTALLVFGGVLGVLVALAFMVPALSSSGAAAQAATAESANHGSNLALVLGMASVWWIVVGSVGQGIGEVVLSERQRGAALLRLWVGQGRGRRTALPSWAPFIWAAVALILWAIWTSAEVV